MNYTLPATDSEFSPNGLIIDLNFKGILKNGLGELYANVNMSNVYVKIVNSTHVNGTKYTVADIATQFNTNNVRLLFGQGNCGGIGKPDCQGEASYAIICVNGTSTNYRGGIGANYVEIIPEISLNINNFTKLYTRNFTFLLESTGANYNFAGTSTNLNVWCPSLTSYDINLTSSISAQNTYYIQTLDEPKISVQVNNNPSRTRQDVEQQVFDNFIISNSMLSDKFQFRLLDYSGGEYYKSLLELHKTVNNQDEIISSERFQQDNILYTGLQNNTQYKIVVKGESTQDLGYLYISDLDFTRDVFLSQPTLGDTQNNWLNTNISITTDYGNVQVGCRILTEYTTTGYFNVWNKSGNTWALDYSTTSTGKNIVFSKTVYDNNGTYRVQCAANDTTYGLRNIDQTVFLRNETAIYKGFDLNLPNVIAGVSRQTMYKILAVTVILITATLFSAVSMGVVAIAMAAMVLLFDYVGWYDMPSILIGVIAFTAIFLKLSEREVNL